MFIEFYRCKILKISNETWDWLVFFLQHMNATASISIYRTISIAGIQLRYRAGTAGHLRTASIYHWLCQIILYWLSSVGTHTWSYWFELWYDIYIYIYTFTYIYYNIYIYIIIIYIYYNYIYIIYKLYIIIYYNIYIIRNTMEYHWLQWLQHQCQRLNVAKLQMRYCDTLPWLVLGAPWKYVNRLSVLLTHFQT